jgi:peptidoglycan/LPS O-acetylase OafA/YrhL
MGALLYIAVPTRRLSSFSTLAGIATSVPAMLIFLTAERAGRVPKRAEDFILGLLFAALLYFLIHGRTSVAPAYASGSAFIARSSYTLYLVHFPFFACVAAAMHHRWQPDFKHLSVAVVVFALCYAYAHAVATVFEAHTPVLKQRLLLFTGLTETAS